MPLYEYKCACCGHVFDRLQKMSDPDPRCPNEIVVFELDPDLRSYWQAARKVLAEGGSEVVWCDGSVVDIHKHYEGRINYRTEMPDERTIVGVNECMTVADWIRKETYLCGAETEKLVSRSNFSLKGGCWAKDGYA